MVLKTNNAFETTTFMKVINTNYVCLNLGGWTIFACSELFLISLEILQIKIWNNRQGISTSTYGGNGCTSYHLPGMNKKMCPTRYILTGFLRALESLHVVVLKFFEVVLALVYLTPTHTLAKSQSQHFLFHLTTALAVITEHQCC